jgi:hypothetical protein
MLPWRALLSPYVSEKISSFFSVEVGSFIAKQQFTSWTVHRFLMSGLLELPKVLRPSAGDFKEER